MTRTLSLGALLAALAVTLPSGIVHAQNAGGLASANSCAQSRMRCVTVTFQEAEIRDVIASFAEFSGYSIVVGAGVSGRVSAAIRNQPWDVALQAILQAHGLSAQETHPGILRVDAMERLREREVREPLITRVFRINYVPVQELAASLQALTSERGGITTSPATNSLIVTDTEANLRRIAALLGQPE
jgi:type IV pilus assembly protein PilQ